MYLGNPIAVLAESIASAKYKDLSEILYSDYDYSQYDRKLHSRLSEVPKITKTRRPLDDEIRVIGMFEQTWGSTALGFGGIGGQSMTTAYTVIINCNDEVCVYFNGRFAYKVKNPNMLMYQDAREGNMTDVQGHGRYRRE